MIWNKRWFRNWIFAYDFDIIFKFQRTERERSIYEKNSNTDSIEIFFQASYEYAFPSIRLERIFDNVTMQICKYLSINFPLIAYRSTKIRSLEITYLIIKKKKPKNVIPAVDLGETRWKTWNFSLAKYTRDWIYI